MRPRRAASRLLDPDARWMRHELSFTQFLNNGTIWIWHPEHKNKIVLAGDKARVWIALDGRLRLRELARSLRGIKKFELLVILNYFRGERLAAPRA